MLYRDKEKEAVLYYFYMMADGRVTYSEERLFGTLCAELKVDENEKAEVIDYCKQETANAKNILSVIQKEDLQSDIKYIWWSGSERNTNLARVIWNLVNLGYADTDYSEAEKEIVRYLLDKWEVPKVLYQEMIDTANTMAALTKQRLWVQRAYARGAEQDEKLKRIDEAIAKLHQNIKLSIEESAM